MSTITRDFKMHPQLLRDVIKRQAGSLEKAVTEGVMNAIEAGSAEVRVIVTPDKVEIIDSGKGFAAIDEIERYFEVFGAPHTEEENKIWANFRMGRGQMFSFGVNKWRTANYTLTVDIDNKGLNYEIEENEEYYSGCHITIELYKQLFNYEVYGIERALKTQLMFAPVPIYFKSHNGEDYELISQDPSTQEWTTETEDAYIRADNSNTLSVYNLGILVRNYYAGTSFGVGGVVVSKKQLQVNFARNDIQSTCKVWTQISEVLNKIAGDSYTADKTYTDAEIERIATILRTKQYISPAVEKAKIIRCVTGRMYSIAQLRSAAAKFNYFTTTADGSRIGDTLHRSRIAFVVATSTIDLFKVKDLRELIDCWMDHGGFGSYSRFEQIINKIESFTELTKGYRDEYKTLDASECSKTQNVWLSIAQCIIQNTKTTDLGFSEPRVALCGESAVALAWTDGRTHITYDRDFLAELPLTLEGVLKLALITQHELQHSVPDTDRHSHDQAFYENFHDNCIDGSFSKAVSKAFSLLPRLLKSIGIAKAKADKLEKAVKLNEIGVVE